MTVSFNSHFTVIPLELQATPPSATVYPGNEVTLSCLPRLVPTHEGDINVTWKHSGSPLNERLARTCWPTVCMCLTPEQGHGQEGCWFLAILKDTYMFVEGVLVTWHFYVEGVVVFQGQVCISSLLRWRECGPLHTHTYTYCSQSEVYWLIYVYAHFDKPTKSIVSLHPIVNE